MNRSMSSAATGVMLAVAVAGCATPEPKPPPPVAAQPEAPRTPPPEAVQPPAPTPTPPPPTVESLAGCERVPFEGKIPEVVSPLKWTPKKAPRGFLHIEFAVVHERVFAVGVPVVDLQLGEVFIVGSMPDLPGPIPESQARAAMLRSKEWTAFYKQLFRVYGGWRPVGLVCLGPKCPLTPEAPPPGLLGTTTTYSTVGIGALDPSANLPRYASLAKVAAAQGPSGAGELIVSREALSRLVTRVICAAKLLTAPGAVR